MTTQEILTANFWSSDHNSVTYYSDSAWLKMTAANGKFYVSGNRFGKNGLVSEGVVKTFEDKNEAEEFIANIVK